MHAWRWWWCFLLILELVNAEKVAVKDEHLYEKNPTENNGHQTRERREVEWYEDVLPNAEEENSEQSNPLLTSVKRNPILSRWGRQKLSDFFYYKRKPAFSSWGGKRGPAFSSWGGKRSGTTNINKEDDQKTYNSTNSLFDKSNILNAYTTENNIQLPNQDVLYKILKDKYLDNLSNEEQEILGRIYNIQDDQSVSIENSNKFDEQNLNSFSSPNGINDSDQLMTLNQEISRRPLNQLSRNIHHDNDEDPEEQGNEDNDDLHNTDNNENDETEELNLDVKGSESNELVKKASPSFNSWGGKRAPAFNSWGGKRAPAFNSWGGKRVPAFNSWGGKRVPAFNSWGGKRAPAFNSWGGKRAPAFNSWGGKRAPAFNSWGGKRVPAFNSWGGKRATAFNSWGGKRATAFNSWGGKRVPAFNSWGGKRAPAFNSWGGKRDPVLNSWEGKRDTDYDSLDEREPDQSELPTLRRKRSPAFNSWGGKRDQDLKNLGNKRAPAFNSWGGKRDLELDNFSNKRAAAFNSWGGKRAPAFNSWGGKRDSSLDTDDRSDSELDDEKNQENSAINTWESKQIQAVNNWNEKRALAFNSWGGKRAPAFNSWGGKRVPAFNSWGGKRAPAFNSWGGKRAPAFNSWGGKRAPAFNSWGGKRAPAFNSWGGKRAPAFNSWGGKRVPAFSSWGGKRAPAFNSWGGKRSPVFISWGGKRITGNDIDDKRGTMMGWTGKRLPAFHSWGGKRSYPTNSDTFDITDSENHFLDYNLNNPFYLNSEKDNNGAIPFLTSEIIPDPENQISHETIDKLKTVNNKFPFLENNNLKPIENISNKININKRIQPENDHISISKRDGEGKRNPAFFSWGGKRSDTQKQFNFVTNDDSNEKSTGTTLKKIDELFANKETTMGNEYHNLNKRNSDFSYNSPYMPNLMGSDYERKQQPDFPRWDGKYTDQHFENTNDGNNEGLTLNIRKKRNIGNDAGKSMTLITDNNNLDNVINSDIDSLSSEDIFSDVPTGTMMCCIKRVQYGDRNLFMQMLLRTKSFRDLSWPTIRPIRRGSDFYSWGGKRSSL